MRHHLEPRACELPIETSLVGLLRDRAAEHGHRLAFRFVRDQDGDDESVTYGALDERAMAVAAELQRHAAPGQRALLLFPPGLDFIAGFFGCLYAGVVAVPVAVPGRNRVTSFIDAIVDAANPALILSTAELHQQAAASYAHAAGLLQRPWIAVDQVPGDRCRAWRDPQLDGRQTAFLQYTSGSTSSPKGVILSHENLLANAALIQQAFGNTPDSSAVFWLPLHHDMGLIGGVVQPIYCGGSCTLLAPAAFLQRPALWLETISQTGATVSGGPDFAYDLCVRKISPAERSKLDLSRWQVAFTGAERIRAQTLDRFADAFAASGFRREAFFPCYGLAEATLMVSGGPRGHLPSVVLMEAEALGRNRVQEASPDDPTARSVVGCGQCLAGQRVAVVDPNTLDLRGDLEIGEIWVQGPSVARGYHDRPDATNAAFAARTSTAADRPWLRTGDLGFLRHDQLFVTGRLKDLIIIRGRNLYPEDIEHSADRAHQGLRAGYCAAFSVDMGDRDQLVVVQEVEPRCRDLDVQAAMQAIRRAIAAQHELEIYAIVLVKAGTIPKTSSGKTRRAACRELFQSGKLEPLAAWEADSEFVGSDGGDAATAPHPLNVSAAEIESWLSDAIAARLRIPREAVRVATPFLDLGMSSMDAVEIAAELARWLGRRLSPVAIYSHPNIAALARWLASSPPGADLTSGAQSDPLLSADVNPEQLYHEVQTMTDNEMERFIRQEMARQERT